MRSDGRTPHDLRPVTITKHFIPSSHGSVLMQQGNTRIICTANIQESVPKFMENAGSGWVTAEYSMLPGSTAERSMRDASRGKINGRTHEIQRLIGRALRGVLDEKALGERTIWIDCDVIQADGGTRTASVTGAYVAMCLAMRRLVDLGKISKIPVKDSVAAVSVGIQHGKVLLDLNYQEDSQCDVDMNVVMTGAGEFVEIQGTAESKPFSGTALQEMLELARRGTSQLISLQRSVLEL